MKTFALLAAVSALSSQVSAHYIFQQLTVGGTKYPVGKYIRPNTNYNSPITDVTSNDLRCNEGGASGAGVETLPMSPGGSFTFTTDTPVYHNGPIAIYMAKAPGSVASFDGSGTVWFKIWQQGPTFNPVTWPLSQTYTASLPASLPAGEYLLRIEQLGLHNPYPAALPQFYLACAQISIASGGSGSPGPLVAIPGYVKGTEPGYTVNIYNNFNSYTPLGPAVWSGGNSGPAPTTAPAPTTTRGPAPTTTMQTTTRAPQVTTTTRAPVVTTTTRAPATTAPATGGSPLYGQCGGQSWTGAKTCAQGRCVATNEYYSQCLP